MKILVNGTFDVLHMGHISLLNYSKSLGNFLTVAIDSDERVKEKKGSNRPINNQTDRLEFLINLRCVDNVVIFYDDEQLINLIKRHDILVKGSDYKGKSVIGQKYAKELIFYDRIEPYSSTSTIENLMHR